MAVMQLAENLPPPPAASSLDRPPQAQLHAIKRTGFILAGVVVGVTVLLIWRNQIKAYFVATNFGVVEPGVYRSGQISRHLIRQTLEQNHIGLIVNLSTENTPDAKAEHETAAKMGIKELNFKLGGNGTGDPNSYPAAIKAITEARKNNTPVLVHCQSGAQRTGGVIAAYRILVEGKSDADAFAEAQRYGHNPDSNPKLIPFIEQHLPEWKQQLAQEQVIPVR